MVKNENESFLLPSDSSVPPGFQPKSSTATAFVPQPEHESGNLWQQAFDRKWIERKRMRISQISCQDIETGNNSKVSPAPQSTSKCNVSPSDKNRAISTPKSASQTCKIEETTIVVSRFCEVPNQIYPKILQNVDHAIVSSDMRTVAKGIYIKHGEITKDCLLESDCMRTSIWIGIAKVVQDLKNKKLSDITTSSLGSYYTIIKDAEKMNVNVKWLRSRIDEIKEAAKWAEEEKDLMVESIDMKLKEVESRKMYLERLKSEIQEKEDQLGREIATVQELKKKIVIQISRFSKWQLMKLMDGLV